MEDEAVFSILSKCFSPVDEDDWLLVTKASNWACFLDGMRRIVQDGRLLGVRSGAIQRAHVRCPLQEFISSEGMKALFTPPQYREKKAFAACYFVSSLSQLAMQTDHLSNELDLMAALLRSGHLSEASEFLQESFSWLTDYRLRLLKLGQEALFYLGLVDALLSIRARQSTE